MRTQTSVVLVLLCFFLSVVIPTIALSQSKEDLNKEKLETLDKEIEQASSDKTWGIYKVVGGVAVSALAFPFTPKEEVSYSVPPFYTSMTAQEAKGNKTLFWGCLVVGSILEIWGLIEWVEASNTLAMLRAKRINISFKPTLMPDKKGNLNPGLSLQMNF